MRLPMLVVFRVSALGLSQRGEDKKRVGKNPRKKKAFMVPSP